KNVVLPQLGADSPGSPPNLDAVSVREVPGLGILLGLSGLWNGNMRSDLVVPPDPQKGSIFGDMYDAGSLQRLVGFLAKPGAGLAFTGIVDLHGNVSWGQW